MKRFSAKSLLMLSMMITLFSFNACQKDSVPALKDQEVAVNPVFTGDRSAGGITYGVTIYTGGVCRIVGIDENTGNVISAVPATYFDPITNTTVNLDNLKGICYTAWGQWFLTTGLPASNALGASVYDNSLCKVNPATGQCSYFGSICPWGPVSDLEYDPIADQFVGLLNNTNSTITISLDVNHNYTVYSNPQPIIGIQNGFTLKGLSLVRDNTGLYYVGAASRLGAASKLYTVPALTGGIAAFMTDLAPLGDFSGGHNALGFDIQLNHLAINRGTQFSSLPNGLSEIRPWAPVLGGTTPTTPWGPPSFDFEDLTSYIY